jgi:DNA-binding transcriptional LysR family regulator
MTIQNPTLFQSFSLTKDMTLRNRIIMAPMTTWSANDDGTISEQELQYLRQRVQGVGLGLSIEKDMIAVPISHPIKMCLVASPEYMQGKTEITSIQDLNQHFCIGIKLLTSNSLLPWDFKLGDKQLNYKPQGNLIFTGVDRVLDAVVDGLGVAYLPLDIVQGLLDTGKLLSFLNENVSTYPPLYLFYTSRRFNSPAFQIVCNALKEN